MIKKGHRRTQSATIATAHQDEPKHNRKTHKKEIQSNEVCNLLSKCDQHFKQKIFCVDLLNIPNLGKEENTFKFGKGIRSSLYQKFKPEEVLISIPQKSKNHEKMKKIVESKSKHKKVSYNPKKISLAQPFELENTYSHIHKVHNSRKKQSIIEIKKIGLREKGHRKEISLIK